MDLSHGLAFTTTQLLIHVIGDLISLRDTVKSHQQQKGDQLVTYMQIYMQHVITKICLSSYAANNSLPHNMCLHEQEAHIDVVQLVTV